MDGIVVKVRDNGRIINKTVYLCVGLKQNGLKEVLGMWVGKSESSSFRIGVLTDLKARGVQDILITYADNLNGFTDTIRTVFPSYSLKSVWYIRSETLVNMSFIRTRKSLRQIWRISIMRPTKRLLLQNLTIWKGNGEESILTPYFHGETTGMIWLFSSSSRWKSENNLYYKSHWKPERKNQKVHEIKAFIPFRWCSQKDRVSFTYGDWEEMDTADS